MGKELLFEIGTEEIPSGYIPGALEDLRAVATRLFQENRLPCGAVRTLGTPRRLLLYVSDVAEKQEDTTRTVVGPARSVAFDREGRPTKAALGFARSQGVAVEALQVRRLERGEYAMAVSVEKGVPAGELLRTLLPQIVTALSFPKTMRWGTSSLRFVRPIRWLLALYGSRVIPFSLDGVGSSNQTFGHRFLSPRALRVRHFSEYLKRLEEHRVIADPRYRREMVLTRATAAATAVRGTPLFDESVVETVTHLVEYPVAVCGAFDRTFLTLPREVIVTPMQKHQRYFPVVGSDGELLPHFVAISNTEAEEMAVIREGHERVLKARLADAQFFFQEDRKLRLDSRLPRLSQVVFQDKLGTMAEKAERIAAAARSIAETLDPSDGAFGARAERAGRLAKVDLLTQMVREFPELQGTMGRVYALLDGEDPEVAQAIEEHYRPHHAGDAVAGTRIGATVALADKMDSIMGCFGVGLLPTGSEDPYGLRRQAQGLLLTLIERHLSLSLTALIARSFTLYGARIFRPEREVTREVREFLRGRLHLLLTDRGAPPDVAEAVLSAGCDDPHDAAQRAEALTTFRAEPDFGELGIAFKRLVNILPERGVSRVDPVRFVTSAERALYGEAQRLRGEVERLVAGREYLGALRRIATLKPVVDMFFEEVLVMVEDRDLQENRLALVGSVAGLFARIADFTRIAVAEHK